MKTINPKKYIIVEENRHSEMGGDNEIIYSKSVKAGKRIYYFDVKKNRKEELYLAITESKKVVNGEDKFQQVTFVKNKIFMFEEDFKNLLEGMNDTMDYIKRMNHKDEEVTGEEKSLLSSDSIELDINF